MRHPRKRHIHITTIKFSGILKKLFLLLCLCFFFRLITFIGAEAAAESMMQNLVQSQNTVNSILSFEMGGISEDEDSSLDLVALLSESSLLDAESELVYQLLNQAAETDVVATEPADEDRDSLNNTESYNDSSIDDNNGTDNDSGIIETTITGENSSLYLSAEGIYIKNKTEYDIEVETLLNKDLNLDLDLEKPTVLIIHTHGSEAYTPDGSDQYDESDPSRTEDINYNVVRVGEELSEALTDAGIKVIHDTNLYDYPSYTGSYARSLDAIENYLEEYPSIKIVIDLHRDALIGSDGTTYKTVADIDGHACSQVMLVVGTNFSGLNHPDWQQNLMLALHLQESMNTLNPSLARPICLSQNRYNQHATSGSLLLEVGCNGNTLQEAINAVRLFADSAAEVLIDLAD